jgi:5'-3' exonuclease
VGGVGEKSAAVLIVRYGTVEALLAALDGGEDVPFAPKLRAARDYLAAAPRVVRVARDVPVRVADDRIPAAPRDPERLVALSERFGLDGPLNRLLAALSAAQPTEE